jgi:pyridoxamine 5'-phosphate oxidase
MPRRPDMPPLRREGLDPDPLRQFAAWFEEAEREVPLPEAMTLATVDAAGDPDARMVLLKGFDQRGFQFFSNYESEKGRQLDRRPAAALVLYWRELDRQVRIRGAVNRLEAAESDRYFAERPQDSRIGAWASPQSRALAERSELDRRVAELRLEYAGRPIPRPAHWGGYLLEPVQIEFWQGQVARLHDRFRYRRGEGDRRAGWVVERLAP